MTGTPSQTFFQAVLVVIPALFFGGVLSGAIPKPDPRERPRPFRAFLILTLAVFLPVFIEGQALRGALGVYTGSLWITVSAIYILGATAAIGLALTRPWHSALAPTRRSRWAVLAVYAVLPVFGGSAYLADSIKAVDLRTKAEQDGGILDEAGLDRFQEINQDSIKNQIATARNLYEQKAITRRQYLTIEQKSLTALQKLYYDRLNRNNEQAFRTEP